MEFFVESNITSARLASPEPQLYDILPLLSSLGPALFILMLGYFTYKDYSGFLSLGPGGTPSNFYGYLKITFLRLFALSNPHRPDPIPSGLKGTGFLKAGAIGTRPSCRPAVAGIAPHRQTSQRPREDMFNILSESIMKLANDYPSKFVISTSAFEKHCPGLFSVKKANPAGNGEICHAHPSDGGSMHLTLHPEDIKTVLEAGWGGTFDIPVLMPFKQLMCVAERHPLARGGWCSRFVPKGFVMVYAPRTKEEVETVMEIIKAGIGWISGERFVPGAPEEPTLHVASPHQQSHESMHHRCGAVAS